MQIDLIFKVAAIGIIVAVLGQLLIRSGREEQAMLTTLAGLIVVLMIIVANIPYHFWERFALLGYVVAMALVPLVKIPGLGVESHGAYRWIKIPGIGLNLQPAEVAKIAIILFLAVLV